MDELIEELMERAGLSEAQGRRKVSPPSRPSPVLTFSQTSAGG